MLCMFVWFQEFTQALEHIQICSEVWKTLKASGAFSSYTIQTKSDVYLHSVNYVKHRKDELNTVICY